MSNFTSSISESVSCMIVFRFGAKTSKNIGGKATVGNISIYGGNPVEVPFAVVFAVHQFQNTRTARLHRQMNVSANVGIFCNFSQHFVRHIFGVRSGKPDSHFRSSLGNLLQQIPESNRFSFTFGQPFVRIYILPQQSHFPVVFRCEVVHFTYNVLRIAAAFAASGVRNNAVGAKIVAAPGNAYKS